MDSSFSDILKVAFTAYPCFLAYNLFKNNIVNGDGTTICHPLKDTPWWNDRPQFLQGAPGLLGDVGADDPQGIVTAHIDKYFYSALKKYLDIPYN